jgi:hypothetical protein
MTNLKQDIKDLLEKIRMNNYELTNYDEIILNDLLERLKNE